MKPRRRWRIERAGSPTGGYGRGWFAMFGTTPYDATGAFFGTWEEAITFTNSEITRQLVSEPTA